MATRRKPVLRPVASPTDTFVTPGIQAPALGNQSWGAIGALSQTLNQFLGAEQGRDIAYYEDAQRKAPERALAIGQLEKEGKLGGIPKILDTDDPLTQEHLKALKSAGVNGLDSPYAVMMVKQARALARLQEADYAGHLSDPAWFSSFSTQVAAEPQKYDELLTQRREQFLESLGPFSEIARGAILTEMGRAEMKFRSDSREPIRESRNESLQVGLSNKLSPLLDAVKESFKNPSDRAESNVKYYSMVSKVEWDQQVAAIGLPAAKENLVKSLEGVILSNIDRMSSNDIGHLIDTVKSSTGIPDEDLVMQRLEYKMVEQADRRQRDRDNNRYENFNSIKGRLNTMILEARTSGQIKGESDLQEFLYKGAGHAFIEESAARFGYEDSYALVGDIRRDLMMEPQAKSDNPDVLESIGKEIESRETDGLKEKIQLYNRLGYITDEKTSELLLRLGERETNGETGKAYTEPRDNALKLSVASLGDLDPAGKTKLSEINVEWKEVYDKAFDRTEGSADRRHLEAEKAALEKVNPLERLKEFQKSTSWEGFEESKEYKEIEGILSASRDEALRDALARKEQDPNAYREERRRWDLISLRFRREARDTWEALQKDPDILAASTTFRKNSLIAERLLSVTNDLIDKSQGLNTQTPTKEDAFASSGRILQAVKRVSDDLTPDRIRSTIRIREGDVGVFFDNTFAKVAGPLRDYAVQFQTGESLISESLNPTQTLEYKATRAELAAAAVLRGVQIKATGEDAGIYADLASRMTIQDAKDVLKTIILIRGLSPQERISGKLSGYDVKLQDIYGDGRGDWRELVPWGKIPAATSTKELDTLVADFESKKEESVMSQMLQNAGIDPDDKAGVDWWVQQQRMLMKNADKNRGLLDILREAPRAIGADGNVPSWAKSLIKSRKENR